MLSYDRSDPDLTAFWAQMAHTLFWNVNILYEQIKTQYVDRSPEEGPGAQMAVSETKAADPNVRHADGGLARHFACIHVAFWHAMRASFPTVGPVLL
jgi:hypothetical protein